MSHLQPGHETPTTPGRANRLTRFSPRFRFSLGALMLVILVVGTIFGLIARHRAQQRWREAARAQLSAQNQETSAAYQKAWREVAPLAGVTGSMSSGSAGSTDRWANLYQVGARGSGSEQDLVSLEITGRLTDTELKPIAITSYGGRLDAQVVEHLTRAYREHGWRYTVTEEPGPRKTSFSLPPPE